MKNILKVRSVGDYARYVGSDNPHPLVCVIGYAKISPVPHGLNNYDIYGIFFHEESAINLKYGAGQYTISKERFYVSHLVRSVAKKTMVKKSK